MIKVLHIITNLDIDESAANTIETLARLNKHKYQASLVSGKTFDHEGKIQAKLKESKIDITFITELQDEINPFLDFLAFVKLFKIIKKGKYAVVHTHLCKAGLLGRCAAWLLKIRHIVHTPHGNISCPCFIRSLTFLSVLLEKFTAKFTNHIITSSIMEKLKYIELGIGRPSKLIQIYNGLDLNNIGVNKCTPSEIKRELDIDNDSIVFGSIYKCASIDQNEFLITAMQEVVKFIPNAYLVIAEEGAPKEYLIKLSESLNISNKIKFFGDQYIKHDLLNMFDIFVICSSNKGAERIVLEAMYCKKPVIAIDILRFQEFIVESKTGLLVAPNNCNAFSQAMITLGKNKKQIADYGVNAKKFAIDNFSIETMLNKIEDLYDNVVKTK